jgi:hypothetical protein
MGGRINQGEKNAVRKVLGVRRHAQAVVSSFGQVAQKLV